MKIFYFTVLLALFCLCSCSNNGITHDLMEINIDPLDIKSSYDIADDVEQEWDIIALETTDDCLISRIVNLIYKNDIYYLHDIAAATIFLFDKDGKYISKLAKRGPGPDEYLGIDAFTVIEKNIWISDINGRRIMEYDENMQLVGQFGLSDQISPDHMINIGDYVYAGTNWSGWLNKNMQLASYNIRDKELNGLLYVPENKPDAPLNRKNSQLAGLDNTCLFMYSFCDTIFRIENNAVTPEYKVIFNSNYEDIPVPIQILIDPKYSKTIRGLEDIKQTANSVLLGYHFGSISI